MKYILLFSSLLFISGCFNKAAVDYDLILSNVNLIDGTGRQTQMEVSIGIKDGKIIDIDTLLSSKATKVIYGSGKFLIPGLFDCHVHT